MVLVHRIEITEKYTILFILLLLNYFLFFLKCIRKHQYLLELILYRRKNKKPSKDYSVEISNKLRIFRIKQQLHNLPFNNSLQPKEL